MLWNLDIDIEIWYRNQNSKVGIESTISNQIPTSKSNSEAEIEFRRQNRISMLKYKVSKIKIPMSKSKPKSKFQFRHRNRCQNFGKSKHRNFVGILISLQVKNYLRWNPTAYCRKDLFLNENFFKEKAPYKVYIYKVFIYTIR
jgi:hypothetical protein